MGAGRQGRGVVAHIAGEAGIGKTRLVRALREDLAEPRAERVLQCSAHHSSTILYPVVRYFEQQMRLESIETPEERLEALEEAVRGAGLEAAEVVPLLADLLEVSGEERVRQPLFARDARNATLQTIAALLLGAQSSTPCCSWSRTCTGPIRRRSSSWNGSSPAPRSCPWRAC